MNLCTDHGILPENSWALANAASGVERIDWDETLQHPGLVFQAALDHGESPRTAWGESMAYHGYPNDLAWEILREHGETASFPPEEETRQKQPDRGETTGRKDQGEGLHCPHPHGKCGGQQGGDSQRTED